MADTLDIISLNEAKAAVNIDTSNTTYDNELAAYITGVSRRIDTLCGYVVKRTISNETHYCGAAPFIDVRHPPISSVTSCTEYDQDGTSTSLTGETVSSKPTDAYLIDITAEAPFRIYRRSQGGPYTFPAGGSVVVTYVAGRYATTAAVDEVFKRGAAIMFSHLWRREQGVGSSTFGPVDDVGLGIPAFAVPRAVVELLAEYIRPAGIA